MKISAKALIIKGKGLLLLKPKNPRNSIGGWDFPGGCVKGKESLTETLKREVFEETGLRVVKAIPIKIFTLPNTDTEYIIFLCGIKKGKVILSDEHTGFKWVNLKKLDKPIKSQLKKGLIEVKDVINRLSNRF